MQKVLFSKSDFAVNLLTLSSKTKPEDEKHPKHKTKKPHEPRRSYRDDVVGTGKLISLVPFCCGSHFIGSGGEEVWDIKSNLKLTCEKLGIKLKRRSGDVALFELSGLGVEGETQGKATDFRVSSLSPPSSFSSYFPSPLTCKDSYIGHFHPRSYSRGCSLQTSARKLGQRKWHPLRTSCSHSQREGCQPSTL